MPPSTSSSSKRSPSLKLLKTRLKEVMVTFNDIWQFTEQFEEEVTNSQIDIRLEKLDELWEKFGDTLIEIRAHDDFVAEQDDFDEERQEFSTRYYKTKAFLMDKIKERREPLTPNQSIRVGDMTMQEPPDHVRLPQIKLQTFDGDIDAWLSFRDLFSSLIHLKADLPEVEKFHYLKGCLMGEPKNLIDPLPITKANYQIAWDMLMKRYNNCKQLKKRQVLSLFKLPTLSKESVPELHNLLESFERIVQTLDQIIRPDYKDLLLVNMLSTRLDPVTRRGWEEVSSTKEQDTIADLTDFLHRRIGVLESLPPKPVDTRGVPQFPTQNKQKFGTGKANFNSFPTATIRCVACKENHLLYQCSRFRSMLVSERDTLLKTHSLCRNCFKTGHQARTCESKYSCRNCKGRHHTLVCFKPGKDSNVKIASVARNDCNSEEAGCSSGSNSSRVSNTAASDVQLSGSAQRFSSSILLATAVVLIENCEGSWYPARALLDSGSESNFISERLCQRLKLKRDEVDISVHGIGQAATKVHHRIHTAVKSRISNYMREMNFLVLPKVTVNLPTATVNTKGWSIPNGIKLADPAFFESKAVDLVLGIEAFFEFFESGKRETLGENLPILTESVFGWIVCGGISVPNHGIHINCNVSASEKLDDLIARFWFCEEIGSTKYSPEETRCELFYQQTVRREANGRYIMSLPKDEGVYPRLGESRDIAFRRLQGIERRLARDSTLKDEYTAFMQEYLELGHMRKINADERDSVKRCYLPHHPVIKETSTTTKVRVVFDASCKTSTGVSLNDVLLAGPVVQDDLRSIILRSRTYQIMLVSDIEKMFRQVNVCPMDRTLQSILWRFPHEDSVGTYELNTVTYGTKPAPFLASRTLKELAMNEEQNFPLAAKSIIEDTYVDDIITGANNIDSINNLKTQLNQIMDRGGFKLRKWACNRSEVLEGIPKENLALCDSVEFKMETDRSIKALGLAWIPKGDKLIFQFNIPSPTTIKQLTKRQILSVIASLFDPLGLLGATITAAKIIMQLLWSLKDANNKGLDWDQPVPSKVAEMWLKYHAELPSLNEIQIDRCVVIPDATMIEIHCFSDASEKAYGACLYIRNQNVNGKIQARLLTSKSKVAPLKCQTIPRLELCGALLAVQLYEKVRESTRFKSKGYFWTDSTCVLRWIRATPTTWTTFVANRVAKIQAVSEGCQWKHVPGINNPADMISRGISPHEITMSKIWWHGPRWLEQEESTWPDFNFNSIAELEEELRPRKITSNTSSAIKEFSLWEAAVRSAKKHLLKVVGEHPVLVENLSTLLVQVEGCLNSRPLTPLSDDPTDLDPLTPAHFLIGSSLQALPEPSTENIPINRLNRWQLVQRQLEDFWKRWRREYLCQLQGRNKRWKPPLKIDVDKLVVIQDDNQPPMRWKMGRIIATHPGPDGVVRVVTLKTATGILKRPVEKICMLPIVDCNADSAQEHM
ncbi:uncharacterized protein LOC129773073 [Toxorhynchites rutilus septentrionalis]|uniref:uncharacterized protein LOC129773073 n=1 Tax=Toxorhynchites rutilus septentrionalis TaxID=329112 RepID=UPI00247AE1C1|nr:uncharacterized protein LOC129773073 [Toxorhynchites rutilus septentrionalis]